MLRLQSQKIKNKAKTLHHLGKTTKTHQLQLRLHFHYKFKYSMNCQILPNFSANNLNYEGKMRNLKFANFHCDLLCKTSQAVIRFHNALRNARPNIIIYASEFL